MNRVYRIIWSDSQQAFVVVSELAKGHCKSSRQNTTDMKNVAPLQASSLGVNYRLLPHSITQILGVSLLSISLAYADPAATQLPTGGQITQGSGSISQSGATLTIQQNTDKMVGEWNSFNIGAKAAVDFKQPNADSVALNRINDSNPTEIQGKLHANGQVYLLNSSGVIFGKTAQVDVGGLVASTQKLSDENFKNGQNHFTESDKHSGRIENQGEITAHGGVVAFIAPEVSNSGTIKNDGGTVALAAGEKVSLDFNGDGLVTVKIDKAALNALAANKGLIQADGGAVIMSAKSADAIMDSVVNNDGIIQARSLKNHAGRIVLDSEDGTTHAAGTLDVSSQEDKGGSIAVTGKNIVVDHAKINASGKTGGGDVLIGGDYQGKNPAIHNAKTTTISEKVEIKADAKETGKGGKVIIWSDNETKVAANISAKGGAKSGDGGFVETSGHKVNTKGIAVTAASPTGKGGLWLIDPTDTTIDSTVAAGYVSTLNTGTSVTNAVSGDIATSGTVNITKSAGSAATLTLQATGRISLVNTTISSTSGALNLVMNSNSDSNATGGGVYLGASAISTNGGNVTIGGGADPLNNYAIGYGPVELNTGIVQYHPQRYGFIMNTGSAINAGGGNISIRGKTISGEMGSGVSITGGTVVTTEQLR